MKKLMVTIAALCALFASAGARAEAQALIMAISAYEGPVPPLKGVTFDVANAMSIARRLGVRDANMSVYRDQQLTLAGMRKAFDDFYERLQPNDQAFIYFSGHGGRWFVQAEDRCAESVVAADGQHLVDSEMESRLKQISQKAEKVIVFFDSCHSGGVSTRALQQAKFVPKTWPGAMTCEKPVNVLTRNIAIASKSVGSGGNNYVVIASSRDNEVSFDVPDHGGVATSAWTECINGAAADKDRSGGLSAEEIRECTQARINSTVSGVPGYLPHNVTITGNSQAILAFTPDAGGAAAPQAAPAPASPLATLNDIYNRRDDRRAVTFRTSKPSFKIGTDKVEFSLSSSQAGYVYLLMVGSDGKTFDMLFPNALDKDHYIKAGETLTLPRSSWELKAQGPAGKNQLLAIVADAPRDFSKAGLQPAGPFSMIPASAVAAKDIQLVSVSSANAASGECQDGTARRNLVVQQRCSNAYGAAMAVVEESE